MQRIQFDYFHGMEAEQYSFYRVPKVLFTADYFKTLTCEAKVLYGLMLDRMGLSARNRWFDEEDRVYIIFTIEEIMELLCCKTQKAVKLLKELDTENGIGLIEKEAQVKEEEKRKEQEQYERLIHYAQFHGTDKPVAMFKDMMGGANVIKLSDLRGRYGVSGP